MNDLDILEAMQAHLEGLTPPTGYSVRRVHATPPDSLGVVPAIVLLPGTDQVTVGSGNRRVVLTVSVVAYLQPAGGLERKYADLMEFRSWLRASFDSSITIGGEAVQVAITSTQLGTDQWAEQDYLTCTATAEVTTFEGVGFTA